MQLTDTQKATVAQWVNDGCTLAELQRKINEEFNLSLTFMDVRLLVLDLNLEIRDQATVGGTVDLSKPPPVSASNISEDGHLAGGVSVSLDRIVKPGAVVSGQVTFSDGVSAEWMLDQMGRLGLSATQPGYRPSQEDLQSFQEELAKLLQSQGM
ncbi:MAG: hypothetical protein ACOYCD_00310 [Kiritimatiellia bacterium]|jgi:hypothetical protein